MRRFLRHTEVEFFFSRYVDVARIHAGPVHESVLWQRRRRRQRQTDARPLRLERAQLRHHFFASGHSNAPRYRAVQYHELSPKFSLLPLINKNLLIGFVVHQFHGFRLFFPLANSYFSLVSLFFKHLTSHSQHLQYFNF